jgi:putative membrane protein
MYMFVVWKLYGRHDKHILMNNLITACIMIWIGHAPVNTEAIDTVQVSHFASRALKGSMVISEMGKISVSNSGDERVKQFGQMLEQDHGNLQRQLMAIAREEEISIPGEIDAESLQQIEQLRMLKGIAFDQRFIAIMITDHQKQIAAFQLAASTNPNAKLKQFATDGIPILEKHLAKARELERPARGL